MFHWLAPLRKTKATRSPWQSYRAAILAEQGCNFTDGWGKRIRAVAAYYNGAASPAGDPAAVQLWPSSEGARLPLSFSPDEARRLAAGLVDAAGLADKLAADGAEAELAALRAQSAGPCISIDDVRQAAGDHAATEDRLRRAVTGAVTARLPVTDIAKAAGVTRQTVCTWTAEDAL